MIRILACCLPALLTAADLAMEPAWSRATAPGQTTGAVFGTIRNAGTADDRLLSAACTVAGRIELHGHEMGADGVARMRAVPEIAVPAGGTAVLKPGGLHIMFFDLKRPLAAGERLDLALQFAKAGEIRIQATVEAPGAMAPAGRP